MAISKRTGTIGGGVAALAAASITMFTLLSSNVTRVAPGEDLQAAINAAACGAVIEVDAGAVYPANLTLPNKNCAEYTVIQSSRAGELPEGVRINPVVQAPLLATLESVVNAEPVIKTAPAAHHYKFIGLRIRTQSTGVFVYDLVRFGNGRPEQSTLESVPHHLVMDRGWVEGRDGQDTQRGVSLNCADCGVINSHVSNIKGRGMDTQAVCIWNGGLRTFILNNDLQATGENVMVGGSDPAQESMTPRLVEVRRNSIWKPMAWKGQGYTIKNLVEVKNCIGCTIDGNDIRNNWGGEGQSGIGILATVRNQEGSAPYSIIENYVFTNNFVSNVQGAINLQGLDNEKQSAQSHGALIQNNVFDQPGTFLTVHGFDDVTVENNTHLQSCAEGCNTILFYGNHQSHNFVYRNNVTQEKAYGVRDEAGVEGIAALEKWVPGYAFAGNVIATPYAKGPPGNDYPPALAIDTNYRTPYAGKGADIDALLAAQAGSGTSQPSPQPSATVAASPSPSASPSATVPNGIPVASTVEVISDANVRSEPKMDPQTEKFIAPAGLRGITTAACEKDTGGGANVYCPVTFTDSTSGFVAMQFLRVVSAASPSPTVAPTSTPTPATPTPTATPVSTPTPRPSPSPTATPLPFCASGARPGTPPVCRCRNGMAGNSGKCK